MKNKHVRYLNLAKHFSTWSKDPSTQVGAVAIGAKGQVLAQGYNGFPRKVEESDKRLGDRELKYKFTVHAEMNCIYNAGWNGTSLDGSSLYVYGLPVCHDCAKGIIQSGIKAVYVPNHDGVSEKWFNSTLITMKMFEEAGVHYELINSVHFE